MKKGKVVELFRFVLFRFVRGGHISRCEIYGASIL